MRQNGAVEASALPTERPGLTAGSALEARRVAGHNQDTTRTKLPSFTYRYL